MPVSRVILIQCVFFPEGIYDNYWPRAVIIDFYCDSSAGIGTPQYVLEYPSYTYKGKSGI